MNLYSFEPPFPDSWPKRITVKQYAPSGEVVEQRTYIPLEDARRLIAQSRLKEVDA